MNKGELIRKISEKCRVKQEDVNKALTAFAEVIVEEVRDNGEQIQLPGVGTFKQKDMPAHEGFNPLKKEKIQVPHQVTIKFQVASNVKQVVAKKKK